MPVGEKKDSVQCRLLLEPERWQKRAPLDSRQRRYLVGVHRLAPGAMVEVFDGRGRRAQAMLSNERGEWVLEVAEGIVTEAQRARVRLGVALTKGRKLDEVVRMATEIGVTSIEPFVCQRSVPRPGDAEAERRRRRGETSAAAAARQSRQAWLPEIRPLAGLEQLLSSRGSDLGVMLHPGAEDDLLSVLSGRGPGGCLVLVGPEGGFSPEETEAARQAGFTLARLKLPVLQAPTAAVVAAALACLDRSAGLG